MRYRHTLLILAVLIIATFLRSYQLAELPPGLYPDEAMNGSNALSAIHTGDFKVFYPENNGREGLFINIQALLVKWTGLNEPWVLRSASVMFGILTVLGMYALGKELFSARIGFLASLFLATSFWHINFSRIGFRAIMAPAFLVWGVYAFIRALRGDRRNMWFSALLAGAIFGGGLHSYIAYRIMPVLMIAIPVYLLFVSREKERRREVIQRTGLFILGAVLVFLPLGAYFLEHPADFLGRTSQVSVFSSASPLGDLGLNVLKTLGMFNVAGDYNWRHNIAGKPELSLAVGILFLFGFALALRAFFNKANWREGRALGVFVTFLWFGLAMLPVVISNEGLPHALRAILMIPPAMLLAAIGGDAVYRSIGTRLQGETGRKWLSFAVGFFVAVLVAQAYTDYFTVWGKSPEVQGAFAARSTSLARALNLLPRETPKYVVVDAGGVLVNGIPMPVQPVMFMTDTFRLEEQKKKNLFYVLPEDRDLIPREALVFTLQ